MKTPSTAITIGDYVKASPFDEHNSPLFGFLQDVYFCNERGTLLGVIEIDFIPLPHICPIDCIEIFVYDEDYFNQ